MILDEEARTNRGQVPSSPTPVFACGFQALAPPCLTGCCDASGIATANVVAGGEFLLTEILLPSFGRVLYFFPLPFKADKEK